MKAKSQSWIYVVLLVALYIAAAAMVHASPWGQGTLPLQRPDAGAPYEEGSCPMCGEWEVGGKPIGLPPGEMDIHNAPAMRERMHAVAPSPTPPPQAFRRTLSPQSAKSVTAFPWYANELVYDGAQLCGDQINPDIAVDGSGNAYAIWADCRNVSGDNNWDIYFAYRPAGGSWGTNVKVNDDAGKAEQGYPRIAVDSTGNAYAVWVDYRDGDPNIYFSYRPVNGAWSVNVKVNDDSSTRAQWGPSIAVDGGGRAYAIWQDYRNGNGDIYFAYRSIGGIWSDNVKVNDDGGTAWQGNPSIAVDDSGNAYAVWQDNRDDWRGDIYFAYRPASGAWGANVKVNDDSGTAWQEAPSVAVDGAGNAYAVWEDERDGNQDIYFAYRPAGGTWSANVKVNDDAGNAGQHSPSIAVDSAGNAYTVWRDYRNGAPDIYFSYRPAGSTWRPNAKIGTRTGYLRHTDSVVGGKTMLFMSPIPAPATNKDHPVIAADGNGHIYAMWEDYRHGDSDVYFSYLSSSGTWANGIRVNDDGGSTWQFHPSVAVDGSGNAYAVWEDRRNGDPDIYFAYRPANGTWGANVRVNDDTGSAEQYKPVIAVDSLGNAYVVWEDRRNGDSDIYFAYRPAGGNWSANVRVNDDVRWNWQSNPSLAVDDTGSAYAVWEDDRNGTSDIYFSYRPAGGSWEANAKVDDNAAKVSQRHPSISVDSYGNGYVVWEDDRDGSPDIYFSYRPKAGVWGASVKVNDDAGTARQDLPSIAVDGDGNAYAVWRDDRDDWHNHIYFAYRPAGGTWGTNVRISSDAGTTRQDLPDIAVDRNGNAYVVWQDDCSGRDNDVYFAYRPANGAWGKHIMINDDGLLSAGQGAPSIAVDISGNVYAVWQDGRNLTVHTYFSYARHDDIVNGPPTNIAVNTTSDVADGNTASFGDLLWNPGPDGKISLREALLAANNMDGSKTITFTIPTSDPGYDPVAHAWTIQPQSALPALSSGNIILDASTQGVSAYGGPAVELNGSSAGDTDGLLITSGYNHVRGLVINSFSFCGIKLTGSQAVSNTITSNYIGTDITGQAERSNMQHGIVNQLGASYNRIGGTTPADRNVISGNNWHGIENWGDGTAHNIIQGNYIGVDATGTKPLGNHGNGVSITPSAHDILVGGSDPGAGNIIAFNGTNSWSVGIAISGPAVVRKNTISHNSIHDNLGAGIRVESTANDGIQPPQIISFTTTSLTGTACPNCTIEIFSDEEDEGHYYEGTVTADATGAWSWHGTPTLPRFTATATDAAGNTSEFSQVAAYVSNKPWSVNERVDDGQRGCDQWAPTAVMDASGNVYAAWQECHNGNYDIYFSRWDGNAWGTPVRVNDGTGGTWQYEPDIAIDSSGTLYLVWSGNSVSFSYSRDGGRTWSKNQEVNSRWGESPSIVVDPADRLYVTWMQYTLDWSTTDIYAAYSTDGGSSWSTPTRVTDDVAANSLQYSPDISAVTTGSAVIAWQDQRDGPSHIYAAMTTDGGTTWSANVRVDDDPGTASKYSPSIATTPNGHVHVAWTDRRNGNSDIYTANSTDGGATWGTNMRVDDDSGTDTQWGPDLLATSDGTLWAIWSDSRSGSHIRAAGSNDDGATWGTSNQVDDSPSDVSVTKPVLAGSDGSALTALWLDYRSGNYDVRTAASTDGGITWSSSTRVNQDDTGTARQYDARLAVDSDGNALALWEDSQGYSGYYLYAAFRPVTGTWGSNVRVGSSRSSQYSPDLVTDGTGNWYAAWYAYDGSGARVFVSRGSDNGSTWSPAVRVSAVDSRQYNPHLAVDATGTLYAAWWDELSGGLRVSDSTDGGETWGASQPISSTNGLSQWNNEIDFVAGDTGHLYLVWQQNYDIWFSESSDGGVTWSAAYKVNDDSTSASQYAPTVAVASDGTVHVAWFDYRNGPSDIYYARRDPTGVWDANVRANDVGNTYQFSPDIAVDRDGNAYLIWGDTRNGEEDIYYAYRPLGGSWGPDKKVDDSSLSRQYNPRIAVDAQGKLYAIWEDMRDGPTHPYFAWRYSPAPYDLDRNGQVDNGDVEMDSEHWRQRAGDPGWDSQFDLDGDGKVTILDILRVVSQLDQ